MTLSYAATAGRGGLFPEQVERWRQAAQDANEKPVFSLIDQEELGKLRPRDHRVIKALKKDLQRKEIELVSDAHSAGPGLSQTASRCQGIRLPELRCHLHPRPNWPSHAGLL
jgi:hypothetical protein